MKYELIVTVGAHEQLPHQQQGPAITNHVGRLRSWAQAAALVRFARGVLELQIHV